MPGDFTTAVSNPFRDAPIIFREETASTMLDARDLLLEGAVHGTAVVADFQSHGQGRKTDRTWVAPAGSALLFTVILRQEVPLTALSLRAGLAVARVLHEAYGLDPRVKWPNDILLEARKVCGILCRQGATWALVGIGLNVNQEELPSERPDATSLRVFAGEEIDRAPLLQAILRELRRELRRNEPINRRLSRWLYGVGEHVTVRSDDGTAIHGTFRGLTQRGALRIAGADGEEQEVYAGELQVGEP
jgi:BirA family biotin operon repressor/biotin-[acetyl-CoA-carboxylase] ligase